jgi:hypothetical protein
MSSGQRGTLRFVAAHAEELGSCASKPSSGRRDAVGGGMLWEEGCCGRRDAVGGGMLWEEGCCGRRDAVVGGMLWEEGCFGISAGAGNHQRLNH